jgi:hypothetical protein
MTVWHVSPALRASETETSDVSMTSTAIFRCLDAFEAAMTLGVIPLHHDGPSSGQPRPQRGRSFAA